MDCYQKMYHKLFNQITEVIDELQTVQLETEELFISQEPEQKLLQMPDKNKHAD